MRHFNRFVFPVVALALLLGVGGAGAWAQDAQQSKGSITGTVKDADGNPAAGVRVRVMQPPAGDRPAAEAAPQQAADEKKPGKGKGRKPVAEATTDDAGNFSIPDLAPGKYMVVAGGPGKGNARQPVEVKAGEAVTVSLELKKGPAAGAGKKGGDKSQQ